MKSKIFALPYAYGSSYVYNNLKNELVSDYDVIPIEYPGHGTRFGEELVKDIREMAKDAYKQIQRNLRFDDRYALLGYSMGSLVGFEVLRLLKENNMNLPRTFFAFASPAPNRIKEEEDYENYDMDEVKKILSDRQGTSSEILENEEMLAVLSPIIINDSIALRDYNNQYSNHKIDCSLVVARGTKEDGVNGEDIKESYNEWVKFSSGKTSYFEIDGEHFFMFDNDVNLHACCQIIKENL